MTVKEGTRFGPYEFLSPLGAGAMGEVWKATDTRLGRHVAIKVLPQAFASDPGRLQRFQQEARTISLLNHPNIVTLHDLGDQDGSPFLVMELLEGETLRERIRKDGLPVEQVLEIGRQIAKGLGAAHEKGIIHRDLKPENVFITRDERVKILDFGLAKLRNPLAASPGPGEEPGSAIGGDEVRTEADGLKGTLAYMSPEQALRQPLDGRSDLFSLGVILWELLTGKRPFQRESPLATTLAVIYEEPGGLGSGGVPPLVLRALQRCLSKKPEDRFQQAEDLIQALEAARTAEIPAPGHPFPRRAWSLGAAGFATLGIILGYWVWHPRPRTAITSLVVVPFQNEAGDAPQDYFANGVADGLVADLAQIKALKVVSRASAMQYSGARKSRSDLAKAMGVQGILECSVARMGSRVRITAQLMDASQDRRIWARTYDRDLASVLSLLHEVAREVAAQIHIPLTPHEQGRMAVSRQVDPEVYDMTLRARVKIEQDPREQDCRQAIALFRSALERDPGYAPAWAGLAYATWLLSGGGDEIVAPPDVRDQALTAAKQALALDPDLPEAYDALGVVYMDREWDLAEAQRHFEKALELRPGFALAHEDYGTMLTILHDFARARTHLESARELDPISPLHSQYRLITLEEAGQPEAVLEEGARLFHAEPDNYLIPFQMGVADFSLGRFEAAVGQFETSLKMSERNLQILGVLGYAYGRAGRPGEARKILAELKQTGRTRYVSPVPEAWVLIGLGRHQEAYQCVERAFEQRVSSLLWGFLMGGEYSFEGHLLDPRWPRLRDRMRRAVKLPQGTDPWGKS